MPLSSFLYTDDVDDVMAAHVNRLTPSVLRGELGEAISITSQLALTDGDFPYLKLTPNAALDVLLPPEAATNHVHVIENGSGTHALTIKDDSDTTTFATIGADQWAMFIPALGATWKVIYGKEAEAANAASYVLYASSSSLTSPADATTYYFGNQFSNTPSGTALRRKVVIPRAGTIKRADIIMIGTVGSAEPSTMSLRLNNTTDTTLSSAIDLSVNPLEVLGVALNIPVVAGDFFEIKWVTPTWATNPAGVSITVQLFVE